VIIRRRKKMDKIVRPPHKGIDAVVLINDKIIGGQ